MVYQQKAKHRNFNGKIGVIYKTKLLVGQFECESGVKWHYHKKQSSEYKKCVKKKAARIGSFTFLSFGFN
ncbi:MAG: hypothetical protein CFE24_10690 [Flavobacterium sp. BFFFF2]|nr:MAG: hypothetical protein CFE24_10690 [Flavobacterium sp. BFFFF2]